MALIGLDMTPTQRDRTTGWERFLLELSDALGQLPCRPEVVRLLRERATTGPAATQLASAKWYLHGLRQAIKSARVDAVHAAALPPPKLEVPIIWTVHDDLIVGGHPQFARRGARVWAPLGRRALRYAARVVTNTRAVAAELVDAGAPPERVRVIPPSVTDFTQVPSTPPQRIVTLQGRRKPVPAEFLLVVGTIESRKRPDVAAAAASLLHIPVIFVGGWDGRFDLQLLGSEAGSLITGRVSDEELAALYRAATAIITPSAYEGFNFPLLEALSLGKHVVASAIPVHQEVGGPDVHYFPEGDSRAAADALDRALRQRPPRPRNLPGWDVCADRYVRVYHETAEEGLRPSCRR